MIGDSNVEDEDQGVSFFSKILEGAKAEKIEFVENSILHVPCISNHIEQQYVGNIEEMQEDLILHSSPAVEKSSLQINKISFTMIETRSVDNKKQPMMSNEIIPQPCSYLQVA
jgi:pyrrolidone-carboxylate peptidase